MSLREMIARIAKLEAEQQKSPEPYTVTYSDGEQVQMDFTELGEAVAAEMWEPDESRHIIQIAGGICPEYFNCLLEQSEI